MVIRLLFLTIVLAASGLRAQSGTSFTLQLGSITTRITQGVTLYPEFDQANDFTQKLFSIHIKAGFERVMNQRFSRVVLGIGNGQSRSASVVTGPGLLRKRSFLQNVLSFNAGFTRGLIMPVGKWSFCPGFSVSIQHGGWLRFQQNAQDFDSAGIFERSYHLEQRSPWSWGLGMNAVFGLRRSFGKHISLGIEEVVGLTFVYAKGAEAYTFTQVNAQGIEERSQGSHYIRRWWYVAAPGYFPFPQISFHYLLGGGK